MVGPGRGDGESWGPWFVREWARATPVLAGALLALAPLVHAAVGGPATWLYLLIPAYAAHQYEEHAHGRFKAEVQAMLPPTFGPISDRAICAVNVGLVWILYGAVFYLAVYGPLAIGLVACYTTLLNAALHLGMGLARRRYNAGLVTAVVLLLPLSIAAAVVISAAAPATAADQAVGVAGAILVHCRGPLNSSL